MRYIDPGKLKKTYWIIRTQIAFVSICLLFIPKLVTGQTVQDTLPSQVTLSQCIAYALANHELVKQAQIDEDITRRDIRIALSGWYPQLEVDANVQHFLQIPVGQYPNLANPPSYLPYVKFPTSTNYTSSGLFSVNQTLYSSTLFFAGRTARDLKNQASESTVFIKINVYANVTTAFFDVLLTQQQLNVLNEDILRLQRQYKDAYALYQDGITDNIDYQRAQIALSNSEAQKKAAEEAVKWKYSVLKQMVGVVPEKKLTLLYDTTKFESDILMDTTRHLDYNNRIEYQLMQTSLKLQNIQSSYYKWSFLPTVSAFYNNTPSFISEQFSGLYNTTYPSSFIGLKLTLPIFQGMNRLENLSKSRLQYNRLQLGMDYLKSSMSSEYSVTLATYVSNLNDLNVAKKNTILAKNIYNTVKFQYDKGTKAYLEVITSENDLKAAELTYLSSLFQVLTSKMSLEKALGVIQINGK